MLKNDVAGLRFWSQDSSIRKNSGRKKKVKIEIRRPTGLDRI